MALREALDAAVNTVEEAHKLETPAVETVTPVETGVKAEPVQTEKPEAGRTAGRARDEHGRLLPGKAEKPIEKPAEQAAPVVEQPVVTARPPRPSSWKKEMWEHYDKLPPQVAEYIHQREGEFAKGVSTYKADFDRAKPLMDVVGQYEPFLKQQNIKPEQFIESLAKADQTLRYGNPQDKLRMFAKLAQDYQIPMHEMLVQGEDGKVYFNQQYFQPQQTQSQQPSGLTREEALKLWQEQSANQQWITAIKNFQEAKDDKGNPKYPHFETVRQDMDGLLRAGLAKDLESAYTKALRMHDDIWEAEQKAKTEAAQKAQQEALTKQVVKAKSSAVSVKSATPASQTPAKGKGIRAHLDAAIDAVAEPGRV